jgi:flagellar protein FliS
MMARGAAQYTRVNTESGVENASPHKLIQMLIDGALARLNVARGMMQQRQLAAKGENISRAISIIGGLQASLNMEAGGEIAENLFALYDYMTRRLFEANKNNDIEAVEEVIGLMKQIKEGWDGIEEQARQLPQAATAP